MFNTLWCEKYRPLTLTDLILTSENRIQFEKFKSLKEIPNVLLTGSPGIGKTSLLKIFARDVLGCQYLYINASDENGIDTIRNKVMSFAQTKSFDGKIKLILLDEADSISGEGARALRNTMEEFSATTRFVLTGNYKSKIITPIQSRCQSFDLTPPFDDALKRCFYILRQENITIPEDMRLPLGNLIRTNFPDLRKCINDLQRFSISGTLQIKKTNNTEFYTKLYELVSTRKVSEIRKYINSIENIGNSDFQLILKGLFNHIELNQPDEEKRRIQLLTVAEHIYRSIQVLDAEINCYACLLALCDPPK